MNELAKSTVAACIALERRRDDRSAYPRTPVSACLVLRILGEDAVRLRPVGVTAAEIRAEMAISAQGLNVALHSLPGLLAIHAPGTVRIVREGDGGCGAPYVYRLVPA